MTDEAPAGLDAPPTAPRRSALTLAPAVAAAAALMLAAGAGAVLAVGAAGPGPRAVDAAALDRAVDLHSPGLTTAAVVVTEVGNTAVMALLAVLLGAWCLRRGRRGDAVFAVGTMAGAAALFTGLKNVLDRARPPTSSRLVEATNESLPSGHATMSIVVLGTLVVLAWAGRAALGRLALVAAAALWVGAVGATRVYLGVHWFTDVVAGWLVGAAWLVACAAVRAWWLRRQAVAAGTSGSLVR